MPHRVASIRALNRMLDQLDGDASRRALDAVQDSTDLAESAERMGLFEDGRGYDPALVREAIDALPPSIAACFHAALRSALERDLPAVVQWKPAPHFEVQVWESVDGDTGQVGVLIHTPLGREMTAG